MPQYKWLLAFLIIFYHNTIAQLHANEDSARKWHETKLVRLAAIPLTLTGLGLYIASENSAFNKFEIQEEINEQFPNFNSNIDDYLRYVPAAAVYGLDFAGVKAKNRFADRTVLFIKANAMALAIAFPLKGITKVRRPDGSSRASFPSLHTAQAFVAATFMHKEYGGRSIWYSIGAYSIASATGFYRMLNNKHWLSDILVGAGIGIFTTNLAYMTHRYKWSIPKKKRQGAFIIPTYSNGTIGALFMYEF